MRKLTLATISTAAGLLASTSLGSAQSQDLIDTIAQELGSQGYTRIEIDFEGNVVEVDATGPNREGEFVFNLEGRLISADVDDDYDHDGDDYDDDRYDDDDDDDDDYDDDDDDTDNDDGDDGGDDGSDDYDDD